MNVQVYNLAMLLSVDWFFDSWSLLGARSTLKEKQLLQKQCRKIVEKILGGETEYWQCNFDSKRIESTKKLLLEAVNKSEAPESDALIFEGLISDKFLEENTTIELLTSLTNLLSTDTDPDVRGNLPLSLVDKVRGAFQAAYKDLPNFSSICLTPTTDWDKKILACTPDLPWYLGDFATSICKRTNVYVRFWTELTLIASPTELAALTLWYQENARLLAGIEIETPDWASQTSKT